MIWQRSASFFFFNDTATTEIYTLSLHDALPILIKERILVIILLNRSSDLDKGKDTRDYQDRKSGSAGMPRPISYAVFCLKKKKAPLPVLLAVQPYCGEVAVSTTLVQMTLVDLQH